MIHTDCEILFFVIVFAGGAGSSESHFFCWILHVKYFCRKMSKKTQPKPFSLNEFGNLIKQKKNNNPKTKAKQKIKNKGNRKKNKSYLCL